MPKSIDNQENSFEHQPMPLISIGELFARSWQKTKLSWVKVLKIQILLVLAYIIPIFIGILIASGVVINGLPTGQLATLYGLIIFTLIVVYAVAVIYFAATAQVALLKVIAADEVPNDSVWSLLRQASPYAWGAVLVGVLSGLAVLAGLFVFIVGAIIVGVWLSQPLYVYVFEGHKSLSALKESRRLVQGRWWAVFLRIAILQLAIAGILFAIDIFASILFGQDTGESISGLVSFPVSILAAPFSLAYSWYLYQSLKQTKSEV